MNLHIKRFWYRAAAFCLASLFLIPIFALYISQPFGIYDSIAIYSFADVIPLIFEFLDTIPLFAINVLSAVLVFQFAYAAYGEALFDELRISASYRSSVRIIRPWENDPPRSSVIVDGSLLAITSWCVLPWFLLFIFFDFDKTSAFSGSRYFDWSPYVEGNEYALLMIYSCMLIAVSHTIILWSLLRSLKNEATQWLIALPALREHNRDLWIQETQRVLQSANVALREIHRGIKDDDV
jgi:hypothetical protein